MNINNNQNLNSNLLLDQSVGERTAQKDLSYNLPKTWPINPFPKHNCYKPGISNEMHMQIRMREFADNMMRSMLNQLSSAFSTMMNNMMQMMQRMMGFFRFF